MRKALSTIAGIVAVISGLLFASAQLLAWTKAAEPSVSPALTVDSSIAQLLNQPSGPPRELAEPQEVLRFYSARGFQPAWVGTAVDDGRTAMAVLERAAEEGLDPADYHIGALHFEPAKGSTGAAAELDVLLTDGILAYARDMREGRARRGKIGFAVGLPPVTLDLTIELAHAIATRHVREFLNGLEPRHHEYAQLKNALAKYRTIAEEGSWPSVPDLKDSDLASSEPRLTLLRQRLAAEDAAYSSQESSEKEMRAALARYQRRNHLVPGSLNKQTIDALNISAAMRADQISANMERWRWLWQTFESRHIEVNSAETTLTAYRDGVPVVTSKIIAGKPRSPTPIFTAQVLAVTINPSWNIPDAIARREILPKARRRPGYLAREHIVADRPGGRLRQIPGRWNALGRIKLEMPNRFDTYLHDTNSPSLFARQERHLSHGCMRVEQIKALASFVLTGNSSAAGENLEAAIARGRTQHFALEKPVAVYVDYWTALPDESGAMGFVPDAYGLDQKVLNAMHRNAEAKERVSVLSECSHA